MQYYSAVEEEWGTNRWDNTDEPKKMLSGTSYKEKILRTWVRKKERDQVRACSPGKDTEKEES